MSENLIPISRPAAAGDVTKVDTKYPTETISLPSKGWFYPEGHPLASGKVELKMMTAKEEDILSSKNLIDKGLVLDKLLEALLIDKTIDAKDILVCDRNAIFVALRRLAYSDKYKVTMGCPKCGEDNELTIDLSLLDNKPFDFDKYPRGQNAFDFTLPNSGKVITYKLLTQRDDDAIEQEVKALEKVYKEVSKEVTTRLKHTILAVDGNGDKGIVRKFVDNEMRASDSLAFRIHVRSTMPDIDLGFDFKCNSCGVERREDTPIGVQFFWPNR